ncbi:GNAT family N-acetyltransferase [Ornithinibacillus halotolerans]|uniref:N-acetyltransferase n=1 Tax=Ornithinibacillus halotolerans TaxID=1274357 RepID=A0A916W8S9_9BACI|nr:GNAT family N-acetyltransferase [Ornithinibacillus halotolerans]GGA77621.1 N-acetyltransferase [Ornithinibacillus halotolerans]
MIEFQPITWNNFEECIQLQLTKSQRSYLASNVYSLAQSYVALLNDKLPALTFVIYHHETMVGFIMMAYDTAEENEYGDEPCYHILRFMIDERYQKKGYGTKAMKKAVAYLKTFPQGVASSIYISYAPENIVARHLYLNLGFVETGIISEGEIVAKITI